MAHLSLDRAKASVVLVASTRGADAPNLTAEIAPGE